MLTLTSSGHLPRSSSWCDWHSLQKVDENEEYKRDLTIENDSKKKENQKQSVEENGISVSK